MMRLSSVLRCSPSVSMWCMCVCGAILCTNYAYDCAYLGVCVYVEQFCVQLPCLQHHNSCEVFSLYTVTLFTALPFLQRVNSCEMSSVSVGVCLLVYLRVCVCGAFECTIFPPHTNCPPCEVFFLDRVSSVVMKTTVLRQYLRVCLCICSCVCMWSIWVYYGWAATSRRLKITGLFFKRAL